MLPGRKALLPKNSGIRRDRNLWVKSRQEGVVAVNKASCCCLRGEAPDSSAGARLLSLCGNINICRGNISAVQVANVAMNAPFADLQPNWCAVVSPSLSDGCSTSLEPICFVSHTFLEITLFQSRLSFTLRWPEAPAVIQTFSRCHFLIKAVIVAV